MATLQGPLGPLAATDSPSCKSTSRLHSGLAPSDDDDFTWTWFMAVDVSSRIWKQHGPAQKGWALRTEHARCRVKSLQRRHATGSVATSSTEDGEIPQATEPFRPIVPLDWRAGERMRET